MQNDDQDLKHLAPIHNSHVIALSQVFPNNLNGALLTSMQSAVPTSGVNSSLPGSSGIVLGNDLSSPSGPIAASVRDCRYGVPRNSPLSVDEQQRIQHYNQMLAGRNIQQSSLSVPGNLSGSDRGVRMLPGGNCMGLMGGVNRSMAISRPGFQGMAAPSMLNSGSMLSSSMVGMQSPVNMNSGVGAGQGNSMLRPPEALHMTRVIIFPGHNPEHQLQTIVAELQMQNSQGIPAFCGHSSAFSNQTTPPVQAYPGHAQQPHQLSQHQSHLSNSHPHLQGPTYASNLQQQAFAARLVKERQLKQQRYLQQQQQFAESNALTPHVQAQSQLPISSSPLQNGSQVRPQNSSQKVPLFNVTSSSPLVPVSSQNQQKHHQPQHGIDRNLCASGITNQLSKHRQRQPPEQQHHQQPGRQHPNQWQHAQSQQQAKFINGKGRGSTLVHQNLPEDPSHPIGLSVPPGTQTAEKGDPIMPMVVGHPHSSNHSQLQQKLHSGSPTTLSEQLQIPSDNSAQGQVSTVPSDHMLSPTEPPVIASSHQPLLQSQPQSKKINQNQSNVRTMLQHNCSVHSELSRRSQSDTTQVDPHPASSASQVTTSTAVTQGCMDSAGVAPVVTTTSSPWETSEAPLDSNMNNPATQVTSLGSAPVLNSSGNEHTAIIEELCQKSVSLTSHAHNSGAQGRRQQQPQLLPQSLPTLSQQ
ncbi:hypothetical protein RIF29_00614 [Crotalaria pallida]|uniref:Uncharacterized protein n=1 Tax=Crotalaria pallida TaxID=3830 RepID=A0AAN9P6L1_CROPI